MADVQHGSLSDSDGIHEPKGCGSLTGGASDAGKVYVSDGAGSGAWTDHDSLSDFGEIYIAGGSTAFALAAASAYTKLNPTGEWTGGEFQDVTLDATNGEIDLDTAGTYLVAFWSSFDTAALVANVQYYFKYALDGTPGSRIVSVQKNTGNVDHLHVSAAGIVTATAGQTLSIHVAGDGTSSSTNITVTDAGLSVVRIA